MFPAQIAEQALNGFNGAMKLGCLLKSKLRYWEAPDDDALAKRCRSLRTLSPALALADDRVSVRRAFR